MDIPNLKAFVAVAEYKSFSLAAESLFMTQPAISKRVASLESELGVSLFDRLGRQVQLTEAGTTFLQSSRRILSDLSVSTDEVRALSATIGGKLRMATSHHVGIHRLPPVLKTFTQAYPDVELDLLFMDSELACHDVANGTLELAVVTLPDEADANLLTELIWPDPLVIVTAPDHPLANKAGLKTSVTQTTNATHLRSSVTPDVLSDHAAVLPAVGTVTRKILFDALRPFDIKLETALETNYLETIKMMVSVGLGWSALPSSMIDNSIVEVPIKGLHMQRQLGAVQLKNRTLGRAAKAFVKMLQQDDMPEPSAAEGATEGAGKSTAESAAKSAAKSTGDASGK